MNPLSRRNLLVGMVVCAVAAQQPACAGSSDVTETLLSIVGDRGRAAALGERWISHRRAGTRPGALVDRLADTLRAQGWSGASDPAELRLRFDAAVRADYQNGEIVTVEGWQLARTQAELCALAYFVTAGLL